MSKIIVVDGPPGSGVTSVAVKLAQEVFAATGKSVVYISPDMMVPSMGVIFPYAKKGKLHSLGRAMDHPDIKPDDVMKEINTVPNMNNIGYLGFLAGESIYTYPAPTDDKIHALFKAMISFCDYIFVDCDRSREDLLSTIAHSYADHSIQVVNPDLRSMVFYGKNIPGDGTIKVMNIQHADLFLPQSEIASHFNGVQFTLPYSKELKKQEITGALPQYLVDVKYRKVLAQLAKAVI